MRSSGSSLPRPLRLLWLAAWLSLAILLAALGLAVWRLAPRSSSEQPAQASFEQRVEAIDVVYASDVLSQHLALARTELDAALLNGQEETLVQLLRMQAEAASVELGTLRFDLPPRDGFLQEVSLELELTGAYYDLPIFLDGLYRQRHAVEIHRITIEADGPLDAQVASRVEARLFRPVSIPEDELRATVSDADLGASDKAFATTAVLDAARLEACERFVAMVPELRERSWVNRRLVMRTIPRLVRKLPQSPMDWVGATFEGEEAQLATEQR